MKNTMKKSLNYGKKALSLFMAVLMLLTAWVCIATPEASASGLSYDIRITWKVEASGTLYGTYGGSDSNDTVGFTIFYVNESNEENRILIDLKNDLRSSGEKITIKTTNGFPTKFLAYINDDRDYNGGDTVMSVSKIEVAENGTNNYTTLWAGYGYLNCTNLPKKITISPTESSGNNTNYAYVTDNYKNWVIPDFNTAQFPSGYNFDEDRWSFPNQNDIIPIEIYTEAFGPIQGKLLFICHDRGNDHGICYGLSSVAATMLEHRDIIKTFERKGIYADTISDVQSYYNANEWKSDIYNLDLEKFIRIAFVSQWEENSLLSMESLEGNLKSLCEATINYVNGTGSPFHIILIKENGDKHSISPLGINTSGNNIELYVYDTNYIANKQLTSDKIIISKDYSSWSYHTNDYDYGSNAGSEITFNFPSELLYNVALLYSGKQRTVATNIVDSKRNLVVSNSKLDCNEKLISTNSSINESSDNSGYEDNLYAYWYREEDKPVVLSNQTDSVITVSDTNSSISANVPANKEATFIVDDSSTNKYICDYDTNEDVNLTFSFANVVGEISDITVSGTASGSEITATQTDSGLLVTGISDGTVTLTKNDEVIETQEIKDAVGEIEITYDKTGENEDVELEYHSHSYTSSITTPATHLTEGVETFTCDCGDSYTKPVTKLEDHTHTVTNTVAPTCTKNGLTVYTCACGDSYTVTVPATGHSHGDDGLCINCGEYNEDYDKTLSDSDNCSHLCHKSGFMSFIWMIVRVFIKLFKTNPVCECGAAHY